MSRVPTYTRVSGVITAKVGEDLVLLNPATQVFFALNETGTAVWDLLESPQPLHVLTEALSAEYEVDPQRCEATIRSFLDEAATHGVIESS